jgi:transmembrane sensor
MNREACLSESGGDAHEIQMKASRWVIEQRASEDWTSEDQAELEAWLDQSTANAVAYWRASHAWGRTYRIAALKRSTADNPSRDRGGKFGVNALSIAAAFCVFAVVGWAAAPFFSGPEFVSYATPVGGHKILTLSNGSKIELNTDSVLRVSDGPRGGLAILDKGEAYFEIKHDPVHPFVINAGGRKITDVGTKFLVRSNENHLEVALFEGRVLLDAPAGSGASPSNLTTGDVAVATATSTSVVKRSSGALANEVSWRQGVLVFHRTALVDAAAEFNRYNGRKLVIAGLDAAKLKIDGKFRTNGVTEFIEVAEDVLGLRIERRGSQTIMSR